MTTPTNDIVDLIQAAGFLLEGTEREIVFTYNTNLPTNERCSIHIGDLIGCPACSIKEARHILKIVIQNGANKALTQNLFKNTGRLN